MNMNLVNEITASQIRTDIPEFINVTISGPPAAQSVNILPNLYS